MKTTDEISESIVSYDNFFSMCSLQIDEVDITKRQTRPEDGFDTIWAKVIASNDDFTYYADYEINYELYNDGWILENFDKTDFSYVVKNYIDQAYAEEIAE